MGKWLRTFIARRVALVSAAAERRGPVARKTTRAFLQDRRQPSAIDAKTVRLLKKTIQPRSFSLESFSSDAHSAADEPRGLLLPAVEVAGQPLGPLPCRDTVTNRAGRAFTVYRAPSLHHSNAPAIWAMTDWLGCVQLGPPALVGDRLSHPQAFVGKRREVRSELPSEFLPHISAR